MRIPPLDRFRTLRARIIGGQILTLIIVVLVAASLATAQERSARTVELVRESGRVLTSSERALRYVVDMQTAVRGYVLTGDEPFLDPYRAAAPDLGPELAMLRDAVADDTGQAQRLSAIAFAIAAWDRDWIMPAIALRQRDARAAQEFVATGDGKARVDAIRTQFAEFGEAEEARQAARIASAHASFSRLRLLNRVAVGVVLAVAIASFFGSASMIRRLRSLDTAAGTIANGNLERRVPTRADGDELDALARSFATMTDRLRETLASHDAARRDAEQANLAKSDFLAQMSHELRTPLNAILGFSDLLVERAGSRLEPRELQYVEHIQEGGTHLLGLINDVLDLARVESGRIELRAQTIGLDALLEPIIASTQIAADAQGLSFQVQSSPGVVVSLDPGRLRQVLVNLLSNAVKFTPRGGQVTLEAATEDGTLRFTVRDTGMGIPADRQDRVFGKFERLHEDRATIGGSGIGLALAKELVEAQYGEITFQSAEGQGTTFTVTLPDVVRGTTAGSRLLVLEDEIASAGLLVEHAADVGLECEVVSTVADALAAVHRDPPSGVVVDLRLLGERGEQLIQALKGDPTYASIPILVLSIEDDTGLSRQLGADEHLTKPVDRQRLNAWLQQIMAREVRLHEHPAR